MVTKTIYIEDLHFEHETWRKELLFWKDELRSFNNRLNQLANRCTNRRILLELEEFQNRFAVHNNAIDEFVEWIKTQEVSLSERLVSNNESLDSILLNMHNAFREKMDAERKLYQNLKKRFFRSLGKYM